MNNPYPEKCTYDPALPCHMHGKAPYLNFEESKCKTDPCHPAIAAQASGIMLVGMGVEYRRYSDTIKRYHAKTNKPAAEVEAYLREKFNVGSEWYANKLEGFGPLPDGTGYCFVIRDPYKD